MSHPSPGEWMDFLYGEVSRPARVSLQAHLDTCAECGKNFAAWQATTKRMAKWKLEETPPAAPVLAGPAIKWALAALVVLGLGFGIGRWSSTSLDPQAILAAIEPELRTSLASDLRQQVHDEIQADWQAVLSGRPEAADTEFRRDLAAHLNQWTARTVASSSAEQQRVFLQFAQTYKANRQADYETMLALFEEAEQTHALRYMSLRRAVETVAVVADNKFQRTEAELGHLASYTQARLFSDDWNQPLETFNPNEKGN